MQIDTVEAAWDRWRELKTPAYDDDVIVAAIQHPFWEALTCQFLRAEECVYCA